MEGTLGDPYFYIAVATILLVMVTWVTDYFQFRGIRSLDNFLKGSRDVGQQFGDWLLSTEKQEDGSEVTNLGLCSRAVGHEIARSFSMATKGIASGEARLERGVERRVLEGLQSPEVNQLLEFCDKNGIDRDLAGTVYNILEKRGLLDGIIKNNGHTSGGSSTW